MSFQNENKNKYVNKQQLFWVVFGVANEVKLLTATLPAGSDYEDRLQVIHEMKRHVKSIGGKVLRDGFWNISPRPSEPLELPVDVSLDDALPWN